jgi:hypothetical protein
MSTTAFDRAMSLVDMPDVLTVKPSVVQATNALLGHTGTHIIQTARDGESCFTIFLQVIDASGNGQGEVTQVVLPDRVCKAIYRQRQSLIDRARRKPAPKLTKEQRQAAKLREAKRIIRESRRS